MNLRLLATPLVAATLLLSTLSCSKKDDPAVTPTPTPPTPAPVTNTGSFKRDGVTITGTSRAFRGTPIKDMKGNETTVLYMVITESPVQSVSRSIKLEYQNSGGGFKLEEMMYWEGSALTIYPSSSSTATLKDTDFVYFSGTFSGTGRTSLATQSTLTDGVFSNARIY